MKKRVTLYIILLAAGVGLLVSGIFHPTPLVAGLCGGIGTMVLGIAASQLAPVMAAGGDDKKRRIEMADERNVAIREKAAWRSGNIIIPMMGLSALVLALVDEIAGACVIAGLLLVYSASILFFSGYYSKRL